MSQAANHSDLPASAAPRRAGRTANRPFAGAIDLVLVTEPVSFPFSGSVSRTYAEAGWTWVHRDLCPDLISADGAASGEISAADLEMVMPEILARMKDGLAVAMADPEKDRRLRAGLGSTEARDALPTVIMALRSRALLGKAQAFGKAVNTITEDSALGVALQSMPLQDPPLAALLFHAAMGQIANPTRLITTIIRLSGSATEAAVIRMGFSPVIDAVLAHAQNQ